MTGMLASVNSIAEAAVVLNAGVDIVDIKNPHEGALGALEVNAVEDIVRLVNGVTLTSATIGDIRPDDPKLSEYIIRMAETGVDYVKVGLFEHKPSEYFINTIAEAAVKGIKIVIVIFAENYSSKESIIPIMQSGIVGIMLDTKEKKSENLCKILGENKLHEFLETAKEFGLLTGLAGSLKYDDIQLLLELLPDYLGFRGALCSGSDRIKKINEEQVRNIREAIPFRNFNLFQDTQYNEVTF
jgi:(5-formylfuran-3-yl)methyl phosphate synthase